MKKVNWWIVGVIVVLAALFLFGGGMMYGGWGNRGYGMMGNWGFSPFGGFGMGIGMLLVWLLPICVLALIVYGVTSLIQNNGTFMSTTSQASCPHCGKGIQKDWQTCPYCSASLE